MRYFQVVFAFIAGAAVASWGSVKPYAAAFLTSLQSNQETAAIGITGILASLVAVWGIVSQRAVTRRQVTLEVLQSAEQKAALYEAYSTFIRLAKSPGGLIEWSAEDKETSPEAKSINIVLNEYELIAIGIERGIIDFELYKLWHRSSVIKFWSYAAPYVMALRSRTGNSMFYNEFETMAGWFQGTTKRPRRGYRWGQWF